MVSKPQEEVPCVSSYGATACEGGAAWHELPLDLLPPLKDRSYAYWTEPILGVTLVTGLCGLLLAISYHTAVSQNGVSDAPSAMAGFVGVLVCVTIAMSCLLKLVVLSNPDEICRSKEKSYPLPAEVVEYLRQRDDAQDLPVPGNIEGPAGSAKLGSYCVRCFVWRPPAKQREEAGRSHHCNTCQRCVVGFDHHCNLFGRCITRGNLVPFWTLVAMLPLGISSAMLPLMFSSDVGTARL
eukprot:TRINITY_DN38324_c0_g1_i1.p1 TRINITY_DN38324_c0_g1~~TRINITY_DN38324_c0_g1_i1.p1  ORF type:complete len:239 (-),score=33.82 TRINITY_DN38324_c0_g1_i1:86-802(-)